MKQTKILLLAFWLTLAVRPIMANEELQKEKSVPESTQGGAKKKSGRMRQFYVSASAQAGGEGTFARPYQTLEKARDAIRALKGAIGTGVQVVLREGTYHRDKTFQLNSNDSGRPESPIIYRGYPGETVRLVGGQPIDPRRFNPLSAKSAAWKRFTPKARQHVVKVNLRAAGIKDFGKLMPRNVFDDQQGGLALYYNGRTMPIARWPDAPPEVSPKKLKGDWKRSGMLRTGEVTSETEFVAKAGDRMARWTSATDIWAHGFFGNAYADFHLPVANLVPKMQVVRLGKKPGYALKQDQNFYFYNLLEEITAPGEWYLDRKSSMLYFWPPAKMDGADIYVSQLEDALINFEETQWIALQNLTLEGSRGELVKINGGAHNLITDCTLRNAGVRAASISGTENGIRSCEVYGTGNGGIYLSGGDRRTLVPAKNFVRNTDIHHFGQWVYGYKPGIKLSGVGNIAAHNRLSHSPHVAIQWSGNEHTMEYNEIFDVCRFAGDMGAFYSGRNWGYRGNIIRYNFVHDVFNWLHFEIPYSHGIYLDDCLAGTLVHGNIVTNIGGYGILHGGGRDTTITNNILDNCLGAGFFVDNRGGNTISHRANDSHNLIERLQKDGIQYQKGIWASTYPKLAQIPPDHTIGNKSHWCYPEGCIYSQNYCSKTGGKESGIYQNNVMGNGHEHIIKDHFKEFSDNASGTDPWFVDRKKLNMRLRKKSPVRKIPGWEEIPFEKIGIVRKSTTPSK